MATSARSDVYIKPVDQEDEGDFRTHRHQQERTEMDPLTKEVSLTSGAERDEELQHTLGIWQSLKRYRWAVFWSVAASFCIVMESYDTLLVGSLFAQTPFKQHFGSYHGAKIGYEISAGWQAALRQGAQIGSLFGVFIGAFMVDRWGYKITILSNLVFMCPIIGLVTFAPNLGALLAGEIILGLPWGVFSTLAEAYASEVCPIALRAYLTTCVNLAWVIGHLIGAGILRKSADMTGVWAFRMPFAVQWAWQVPLIAVLIFCPESPWWFVRKGKIDQAKRVLKRLAPSHEHDQIDDAVASMQRTNQMEIDNMEDSSWSSLFKGSDLRRTEISAVAWTIQIMCGLQFVNYSTYFFQQAGLETKNAFNMTIALYGAGLIGTLSSWFLLRYFGRRTIFVTGLFGLSIGQLLIGVLSVVADKGHNGARWGQAGLMVGWLLAYNLSVGPLAYVIVGEASSTRLRNKTVAFSRASYNLFSIVFGTLSPYMLNKTAWGWEGKVGFFWAPICFLTALWAFFRLPEMRNRSYYEIDILFTQGVPARKFKSTVVDTRNEVATDHVLGPCRRSEITEADDDEVVY